MRQYSVPLFVPFNVRNKIINENHPTRKLDINEYKPQEQVQVLLSYLKEKQIHNALKKSNLEKILYPKNRGLLYDMHISHGFHPILSRHSFESRLREYRGMMLQNVGFLGAVSNQKINGASLKAYWRYNEASGTITNDAGNVTGNASLGSAADGTTSNLTYNQAVGPFSYSGLFGGTNSKVTIGSSLSQFDFMHNTTSLFTVAFWMRKQTSTGNTNNAVLSDHDGLETAQNVGCGIYTASDNNAFIVISNATNQVIGQSVNISIPDVTNWYFYFFTWDVSLGSNNAALYRNNGNLVNGTKTANTPSNADATIAMLHGNSQQGNHWLKGYLAEISIWNRILTSGEQSFIYNGGSGRILY